MEPTRLTTDLNYILQNTAAVWAEFKNKKIFITGGTGFIGSWLLETFLWANRTLELNLSVTCLTRNPQAFASKAPHLAADPALLFITGDVRNFVFPHERFSHIIHGASEASAKLNQEHPQLMLDTIIQGTRHVLDFAAYAQTQKLLLLSSGAVYGKQPAEMTHVSEAYSGPIDILNPLSAHAVGKHTAEHMCILHATKHPLQIKIARCFAFVGPYLPLERHFAMGNFIRDAMSGKTIVVEGDGTPYRSYQYAADLMIWLLKILCHGESCVPYNVGSDEPISIAELAKLVANCVAPGLPVTIAQAADKNKPAIRYIPDVQRAQQQLGLATTIKLPDAIRKTVNFYARETIHD
ncbi:MAG: NAD-dependent epimerase/dehydratase family protein [Pseudomonadota bacterium]